jgi:hypothetical protein
MSNLNPRRSSIEEMDRLMTAAKQLPSRPPRHIAARINSVVTASDKLSTRPTLVRAHVPLTTAGIRKRLAIMGGPLR